MAMTDYLESALINHVLRFTALTSPTTVYLALWVGDPTDTEAGGAEVSGGSYARQAIAFDVPSPAGQTQNTGLITFPVATAGWGTVTHCMIMDAVSAGNGLTHAALSASKTINTDDQLKFAIGDVQVDFT